MCIICVSERGIRQPTKEELRTMYDRNPDGCGYMFVRDNQVIIHKGFMNFEEFYYNVKAENFTKDDVTIYHFRIATQGGINPQMTHPFPLTKHIEETKILDCSCSVGIAHNGIIPATTDRTDKEYSDTAHFVAEYLPHFIHTKDDINPETLKKIESIIQSKMVILTKEGELGYIGNFVTDKGGLKFSNTSYKSFTLDDVNLMNRSTWIYKNGCKKASNK